MDAPEQTRAVSKARLCAFALELDAAWQSDWPPGVVSRALVGLSPGCRALSRREVESVVRAIHEGTTPTVVDAQIRAALSAGRHIVGAFVRLLGAVGYPPLGESTLPDALEALADPAFVLFEGKIAFANAAARLAFARAPAWLCAPEAAEYATVKRLTSGGRALTLVLPRASPRQGPHEQLPPALRRTAELLARGLSDKEIAGELHLSYSTVRTYVTRVYERLGISDRRALIMRGA